MKLLSEIIIGVGLLTFIILGVIGHQDYKKKPESVEQPEGWIQQIPYVFSSLVVIFYMMSLFWGFGVVVASDPLDTIGRLVGLLIYGCGAIFSFWAAKRMGKMLRPEVMIQREHQLVVSGPFHYVRHPIYFGGILTWLGIGLALSNFLMLATTFLVVIPVYRYRAKTEEQLLLKHFGQGYKEYQARTSMLFPKIK